jgi:hypothetical protein
MNTTPHLDAVASDRRALLRLIVGDAVQSAPTASAETSAGADKQDNLRNIGQRLLDLEDERLRISAEYLAAPDRMNEVAPLPPKPRPRKIEEGKPKPLFAKPLKRIVRASSASDKDKFFEDTPADAYWRMRWESQKVREAIYQTSWRYQRRLASAARECGYADALEQLEKVKGQIRQTAAEAFEIEARTSSDVAVQGYALLKAFAAEDGRAYDKFAKKLACNAIGIIPLGGGGSRVTPTVRTVAA